MTDLRLELSASEPDADGGVFVRLLVINAGYDAVRVDRRLLWGPHPESGTPGLLAGEPSTDRKSEEIVLLNPWGIFGRERRYRYETGETMRFYGYLLRHPADELLPTGPGDRSALEVAADPLEVQFR